MSNPPPPLENAKRYLREGAYGCPFCDDKDGDRSYNRESTDGDLRSEYCYCKVCGNQWMEVYWLAYIHDVPGDSDEGWEVRKEWAEESDVAEFVEEIARDSEGRIVYG